MSVDILILSLGTTRGLQVADVQLAELLREVGVTVAVSGVRMGQSGRLRVGYPWTEFIEAYAARRALRGAIARHRPGALVLATSTNSLLTDPEGLPYAIWFDSPGRLNRPGLRNAGIHVLERRSFRRASVLLPWCEQAMTTLATEPTPIVPVSPPIRASGRSPSTRRERVAIAYAPEPWGKGLELIARTWASASADLRARLLILGITREHAARYLQARGLDLPPGAEFPGMLTQVQFHDALDRARVFLSGALWEDFGLAPLEALDRGAVLVAAPGGGPFPALEMARALEPRFVAADRSPEAVAASLRAAFDTPDEELVKYRLRALTLLEPYRRGPIVARLRDEVLPLLRGTH